MYAKECLIAFQVEGNQETVKVVGLQNRRIVVHGASCTVSVPVATESTERMECNSFTITLGGDEHGAIALTVLNAVSVKSSYQEVGFLLSVKRNEDGLIWVDLENEFIPGHDRIGGISDHILKVKIGDQWFSEFTPNEFKRTKNTQFVDGNLLCRYLAGLATADDVMAAATKAEEEINASNRIENLEKQVKGLTESLRAERSDRSKEQQEMSILGYTLRNTQLEVKRLGDISTWYRELKGASDVLMKTAVTSPFYAIERLRRACCSVSNRVDEFPQKNLDEADHQDG